MKMLHTVLVSCALACAAVGCSVDSGGSTAEDAPATVVHQDQRLTIESGADRIVATIDDGSRTIEYFEGETSVGKASFDPSSRVLTVHSAGFDKTVNVPVGAEVSAAAMPGVTDEENGRYMARASGVATRLAHNANVTRELEGRISSSTALRPQARAGFTCDGPSGAEWLLSPFSGWWMIFNCL